MNSPSGKLRIIVGGMVGQFPLGGVAWDYFHYVLALAELGHDVVYHEDTRNWPHDPVAGGYQTAGAPYTTRFIREFFQRHAPQLADRWHYVLGGEEHHGMTESAWRDFAASADVFLNVSGACQVPEGLPGRCVKVFMDTDPGYNQIRMNELPAWDKSASNWRTQTETLYDRHLTYAENLYAPDCKIPRLGINWLPTRCVVTLAPWNQLRQRPPAPDALFTTVMTFAWFNGPLVHEGVEYGTKSVEYERFKTLPRHVPGGRLALAIAGQYAPLDQIRADGWKVIDANAVTLTAERYVDFIGRSAGEWSIAKNVYAATNSGWFSCRTACYLAAGRPAVVQDTAWSRYVPSGEGVIAFSTMEDAIDGLNRVMSDPARHQAAAYEIAREYLAPDRVIPPMLEAIFSAKDVSPRDPTILPPSPSTPTRP